MGGHVDAMLVGGLLEAREQNAQGGRCASRIRGWGPADVRGVSDAPSGPIHSDDVGVEWVRLGEADRCMLGYGRTLAPCADV